MRLSARLQSDHPRRCGENRFQRCKPQGTVGSPPQVRGKHHALISPAQSLRITPAGAGKTGELTLSRYSNEDHPRRCGENASPCRIRYCTTGSPPQVRGKPASPLSRFAKARITPAGAGKTCMCAVCNLTREDHPRRCGENENDGFTLGKIIGSPPQVRGKRYDADRLRYGRGITPAGAGKTHLQV